MPDTLHNAAPFKVFGLQRTGTNLMQALLESNFHAEYLNELETGWKHGPMDSGIVSRNGIPTRFVVCVRNPYAWLASCYRYFRRQHLVDETMPADFRRDPTMSFEEFVHRPSYGFQTPVHRWNFMNRLWRATLPAKYTMVVRQEDQLNGQQQVLEHAECQLGLIRQNTELRLQDRQIDVYASVGGRLDRDSSLLREYMLMFSPSLLEMVNGTLDRPLMRSFGYDEEEWALGEREMNKLRLLVRQCTSDGQDAWELAQDPYRLMQIKDRDGDVRTAVDVGAHIGVATVCCKRMWPDCKILAYEPDAENYRMLCINTRRLGDVQVFPLAMTDGASEQVRFGSDDASDEGLVQTGRGAVREDGPEVVKAVGLEHAVEKLGNIDLLKIGCSVAVRQLLMSQRATPIVRSVRWICGRLENGDESKEILCRALAESHTVSVHSTARGQFFVAESVNRSSVASQTAAKAPSPSEHLQKEILQPET